MTDIAVVGFAHAPHVRETTGTTNGVEMLVPCFQQLYTELNIDRSDIDFWCSGSSDYLSGRSFSFIAAIDAVGAVPPINESHVEMDAAWALYEAWVKLLTGEIDTALVYGFGKSSSNIIRNTLSMQLDPYLVAPLGIDAVSLAAMQARMGIDAGLWTERDMAEVAVRARQAACTNPHAHISGSWTVDELLATDPIADPLRRHDCPPSTDGAAAIVLARGDRARDLTDHPVWIRGIDHRIDSSHLTARDWLSAPSARHSAAALDSSGIEVAMLHAPFTHQELLLLRELGIGDDVVVNPDGGPLTGNPLFSGGLERIGQAALAIRAGHAHRALAHATSGPLLQQNLVTILEGN